MLMQTAAADQRLTRRRCAQRSRIVDRAEVGERRCAPWPNSFQVGLSYDDRSSRAQPFDQSCVGFRDPICQNLDPPVVRTRHLKHVFDSHRNAVERAAIASASNFFIRLLCVCERLLGENRDEGVELIFDQLQTCQSGFYASDDEVRERQ